MSLHPYLAEAPTPRLIAHRGFVPPEGVSDIIENTHGAFAAALEYGATHLETDCHLTREGSIVLFHDTDLRRITGESIRISELTEAELRARMADRGGLVTLGEAFEAFPDARFNVDVKAPAAAIHAGRIISPHAHRVLLTSFSDPVRRRALAAAREVHPFLPATSPGRSGVSRILFALAMRSERLIARALEGLDALQIPERQGPIRVLSPRLIDAATRHGVEVHVWTVNDRARMRELVTAGVAGIVTDRIDRAVQEFLAE